MLGEMCTKPVVTVTPTTSVRDAARVMRQKKVGAVVVLNGNRPAGILTDRDIAISVVADGRDPATVEVGDVMHRDLTVIPAEKGIMDATKTFAAKGVRRLPVVDRQGKVMGILSLDDLLMLLGQELGQVASALQRGLGRRAIAAAS
jgi:CBS domain-containing protein